MTTLVEDHGLPLISIGEPMSSDKERIAELEEALREAIHLADAADACCDSEFRISTDPPCETEVALARLGALLENR